MEFYDEEIKQSTSSLSQDDLLALVESLFNNMVHTMRVYYLNIGHSDKEVQMLIKREVDAVKQLLSKRVKSQSIDEDSPVEKKPKNKTQEFNSIFGNQFKNDALIDLNLLMGEIYKSK